MTPMQIVRKTFTAIFVGMTMLASTTFQNGCAYDMTGDVMTGLLDSFESDSFYYSDPYGDSYSDWDYGYYETPAGPLDGWAFGDVKSG